MSIPSRAAIAARQERGPTTGRRRALRALMVLGALCVVDFAAAGGSFAIRNGTVAGGGGIVASGNVRIVWTIGEAAMGTTAANGFRLTSGFPATIGDDDIQGGPIGGDIFKDGFEDTGVAP